MADTKRQNAGGKAPVATPNMGPSTMVSLENALAGVIGARLFTSVRLQTTIPSQQVVEGVLFTACPITNLVAVAVPSHPPSPPTHRILPISSIQSFAIVSAPPAANGFASPPATTPALATIPTAAFLARADAAVARLKEAANRKNKAVGKEAQDLFDGLSRLFPVQWDGNNMVVMDSVVISAPYRAEDCRAGNTPQSQQILLRVRKVVSLQRASSGVLGET
ncbi:MAG: hypothetical protein Q9183_004069 [Haloplaca sp. 2 TL-2023]